MDSRLSPLIEKKLMAEKISISVHQFVTPRLFMLDLLASKK
jgi:hypothetical protein